MARPKKWTEEALVQLGTELVEWMLSDVEHVYWQEFLVVEKGLYKELISQMTSQSQAFSQLVKRAKDIQEVRLVKKEGKGEIKSIFVLKNHHGYADKQEVKTDQTIHQTVKDISELRDMTTDDLKEQVRSLTERLRN